MNLLAMFNFSMNLRLSERISTDLIRNISKINLYQFPWRVIDSKTIFEVRVRVWNLKGLLPYQG